MSLARLPIAFALSMVLLIGQAVVPVAGEAAGTLVQQRAYELKQQKLRIEAKRNKIRALAAKEAGVKRSISVVQQKLERTSVQLSDTQYRFQMASHQVAQTTQQLGFINYRHTRQLRAARLRLRTIYKLSPNQAIATMLSATDLSSLIRRVAYFHYVSRKDSELLAGLQKTHREMVGLRKEQVKRKDTFAQVSKEFAAKKDEYSGQADELGVYQQRLRTEIASNERELRIMEQESRQIESMLRRLLASQSNSGRRLGTGRMGWPVFGTVTSPFGSRVHPIFKRSIFHAGLDIAAGSGTPIRAADGGRVIESGWRGGYGRVVIIDHGGGIATLYGHTSASYVGAGQMVVKGQVIAAVGMTGWATGPHLHFEVRKNGSPVNPSAWL